MGCTGVWRRDPGLVLHPSRAGGGMCLGLTRSMAPSGVAGWQGSALPAEGLQDPHGTSMVLGPSHACSVLADVAAGLSCWGQAEVGAAGSSVHHHHPPQWRAWLGWGLAALVLLVLRGWCPGSLTRCGAEQVPRRCRQGFPSGWCRGTAASRAISQPGRRVAGIPLCFSCHQLPAHSIVTWCVLGGCWRLSPSLRVTLGHCGVNVPFHAWLLPRLATATGASTSQQRCSSSETPLPNQNPQ